MERPTPFVKTTRRLRGKQSIKAPRKKYDRSKWKSRQPSTRKLREYQPRYSKQKRMSLLQAADIMEQCASQLEASFMEGVLSIKQQLEAKHELVLELNGAEVAGIRPVDSTKELLIPRRRPKWA